jgi:hypothetical protein
MLYIIEPRTETDKVEAVGFPGISHYYGENSVTYKDEKGDKGEITISKGSVVNCNGTLGLVTDILPMKFGRVILTVFLQPPSKTTTGALMR